MLIWLAPLNGRWVPFFPMYSTLRTAAAGEFSFDTRSSSSAHSACGFAAEKCEEGRWRPKPTSFIRPSVFPGGLKSGRWDKDCSSASMALLHHSDTWG